ncbi:DUF2599 domain-containing protein [Mycobacterium marinum]|uniref:DUF2599 domain-containing protein n=1 Tax=Mycobacterium marinum TaxID=1781 RepID=UPI000B9654F5|nr:DUF2599 domain-containing protein [Mycobacterium marinum]MDC8985512.1 DUF2599 domain-containing protein [Mycobacterium marinum]MDC8995888.1 DUF2599 domain-containing protein [Mycobacterium marinum]MDC9002822.1 DUF2599 domain-containing protein [Mycobacterium marinum]MDC9013538.1 DUF2599 domain-containing protein [Mycobacterium marinum]MDC9017621.1 DUF2599 domain-containing protein [Mycobacterium marinum]
MKVLLAAPVAVLIALLSAPDAAADAGAGDASAAQPVLSPPFVDHTEWAQWGSLRGLRVFPTSAGRAAASQFGMTAAAAAEAWAEVLALAPEADTPGMRAQFVCHWDFAEVAAPGKSSWNLEPWRPVVDDAEMIASGCNPGGPEEAELSRAVVSSADGGQS